ncbi:MAG: ABC transporter ATP-binding protein [Lactobacillaceae bacterium]|jgi:ABC-2 type transport system ATP-binding protein|nr:ABC transporter ATP-binding protein [Lactobacillaceae bacterium]
MKIKNLSKKFNDQLIFQNINIDFEKGKIYSIFGKNGIGKTTLLNILNGNLDFDEGNITNNDETIFIADNDIPFEFMTANDFIEETFKFKNYKYSQEEKEQLFVQLDFHTEDKIIKDFSKGMKSKLYLIIAFLSNPKILLLDEPFVDIDIISFQNITQILKDKSSKMTIIFSTHIAKIAYELADEIIYLQTNQATKILNNFKNSEELEKNILNNLSIDTTRNSIEN